MTKTAFVSWRSGRSVGDSCGGIRLERIRAGIASLRRPGLESLAAFLLTGTVRATGFPRRKEEMAFGAGVLLMFALGSGRYLEAEKSRQAYLGELQDGMYVTVQGQLAGKQIQKNRYVYELTSCMFLDGFVEFLTGRTGIVRWGSDLF